LSPGGSSGSRESTWRGRKRRRRSADRMRLLELNLQNFRQHADTRIRFRCGLTGIVGPNGAGKSTLLEAIGWALYGADATRGTNETLLHAGAEPGARVEVELKFSLGGSEYQVMRSLTGAEV